MLQEQGTSTNLLTNAGFESDLSSGWVTYKTYAGTGFERSTWGIADNRGGNYGLAIHTMTYGFLINSGQIDVTAGETLELTYDYRGFEDGDVSQGAPGFYLDWYDGSGGYLSGTGLYDTSTQASAEWQEFSQTTVVPTGAEKMRVRLINYNAAGWVNLDDIEVRRVLPVNTIERTTYSVNGTPIAQKISGDPTSGNNGTFYLYTDHLGSPTMIANSSNVVQSRQRYYPFGEQRTDSGPDLTNRGYTGHQENRDIGLTYMNARYYVSDIGSFASADTIVPDPADPQTFNRYSYVTNNPINIIDPSGHYGDDVHHDETLKIIRSVRKDLKDNLSLDVAQSYNRIADINVGTDYDPITTPFLEGDWEATVNNMTPQWFTDPATGGRLHEAPTEYYHFRSRATYETRLQQAISSKSIKAFGIALHGYQDSFSHIESGYTFATGPRGVAELYGKCSECFDSFGGATLNIVKAYLDFGHSGSSILGINTDAFSVGNPRDDRMVAGTTYWITMYILNDYRINADEYYMEHHGMTHDEWYQQHVAQD